ncbi:MAG: hypothetical protein K2X77_07410 [Candidatus Obscuribacterales bacterium]|jgi:hypothetical protein|nr:hypothetical protein [Candidatus Obscuribacterales bacterium]
MQTKLSPKFHTLSFLSILAAFTTAAFSPQNSFAGGPSSEDSVPPNSTYTPLIIPADALARGISLSGDAKLYRIADAHYRMGCGSCLIHAEAPMRIETCRTSIFIREGASIVICTRKDVTRVLNLSDRHRDSVRVLLDKYHLNLNPGEEVGIVGAQAEQPEKIATETAIRYRKATTTKAAGYNIVVFEFSLADALKNCLIFKQLTDSKSPVDKVLLSEIIKTAAAVNTMFDKSHGKYTNGEPTDQARTRVASKKSKTS